MAFQIWITFEFEGNSIIYRKNLHIKYFFRYIYQQRFIPLQELDNIVPNRTLNKNCISVLKFLHHVKCLYLYMSHQYRMSNKIVWSLRSTLNIRIWKHFVSRYSNNPNIYWGNRHSWLHKFELVKMIDNKHLFEACNLTYMYFKFYLELPVTKEFKFIFILLIIRIVV